MLPMVIKGEELALRGSVTSKDTTSSCQRTSKDDEYDTEYENVDDDEDDEDDDDNDDDE